MRYIAVLLIMIMAIGCVSPPPLPVPGFEEPEEEIECRTVFEEVPGLVEECEEVQYTEEVCGRRALEYISTEAPIVHLCMLDGECGGKSLAGCKYCQKAMTRCTMIIHNLDPKKSGAWTVGANFSLDGAVFSRDPVMKTIDPNETESFDFQHFYTPGVPINSATCKLFVIEEAVVDDCQDITRAREECANVTKLVIVEKEVCE